MKSQGLALRSAGEGPLLLLLHGLGSSSLDWQAQIERFSEHYRVVALDLRGHGQSLQEGPFDVGTLAGDVARWLDEQPEPAWVVEMMATGCTIWPRRARADQPGKPSSRAR